MKNDQTGERFASDTISFPKGDGGILDAHATFCRMLALAPTVGDPRKVALFSDDAGLPITRTDIDIGVHAMLRIALPESEAARYSAHSFRIGAATALFAAGVPMEVVKRLCRWMSDECPRMYARLTPEVWEQHIPHLLAFSPQGRVTPFPDDDDEVVLASMRIPSSASP